MPHPGMPMNLVRWNFGHRSSLLSKELPQEFCTFLLSPTKKNDSSPKYPGKWVSPLCVMTDFHLLDSSFLCIYHEHWTFLIHWCWVVQHQVCREECKSVLETLKCTLFILIIVDLSVSVSLCAVSVLSCHVSHLVLPSCQLSVSAQSFLSVCLCVTWYLCDRDLESCHWWHGGPCDLTHSWQAWSNIVRGFAPLVKFCSLIGRWDPKTMWHKYHVPPLSEFYFIHFNMYLQLMSTCQLNVSQLIYT